MGSGRVPQPPQPLFWQCRALAGANGRRSGAPEGARGGRHALGRPGERASVCTAISSCWWVATLVLLLPKATLPLLAAAIGWSCPLPCLLARWPVILQALLTLHSPAHLSLARSQPARWPRTRSGLSSSAVVRAATSTSGSSILMAAARPMSQPRRRWGVFGMARRGMEEVLRWARASQRWTKQRPQPQVQECPAGPPPSSARFPSERRCTRP
jgi:hypothetical protein